MTALPKASGMVEDHPPRRKTLSRGRFLWIRAAGKNTQNTSPAEEKNKVRLLKEKKKASQRKQVSCKTYILYTAKIFNVPCFFLLREHVLKVQHSSKKQYH